MLYATCKIKIIKEPSQIEFEFIQDIPKIFARYWEMKIFIPHLKTYSTSSLSSPERCTFAFSFTTQGSTQHKNKTICDIFEMVTMCVYAYFIIQMRFNGPISV